MNTDEHTLFLKVIINDVGEEGREPSYLSRTLKMKMHILFDLLREILMFSSNLINFNLISINFHLIQSTLSNRNHFHLI